MKAFLPIGIAIGVAGYLACAAQTASTPQSGETGSASPSSKLVPVDDSRVTPAYANFSRVTGTPEELILDFGINTQPSGTPKDPITIDRRIILNFYTAKRFAAALQTSIDRYEQTFGPIETDVQKRIKINP